VLSLQSYAIASFVENKALRVACRNTREDILRAHFTQRNHKRLERSIPFPNVSLPVRLCYSWCATTCNKREGKIKRKKPKRQMHHNQMLKCPFLKTIFCIP